MGESVNDTSNPMTTLGVFAESLLWVDALCDRDYKRTARVPAPIVLYCMQIRRKNLLDFGKAKGEGLDPCR